MPRKIRELKRDLRHAGFASRPGKGSHTFWRHPLLPAIKLTISGHDGDDAPQYQEEQVRGALEALRAIRGDSDE
ncbi:MAG TPA: type II toxin-antitoxin system HicA family toxin [Chloroflexota bacterium]|jgi:predicted RNA binding protein YcfA (HicA-like mRNA interferase family)|nr:type II toxin-antitoxin system HicA family toxin [Chloroflexota bacterium]